jgi:hypothetical protein
MRGQFELFGGLPFADVMPAAGKPEVRYTPAEPLPNKPRKPRVGPFEKWLRDLNVPYVKVAEAKRAIFPGSHVEAFDFLIYREAGPNLLVLLNPRPGEEDERRMKDWEQTFGEGFAACFAWRAGDDWRGILMADWRGRAEHARPLRDLL